MLVCVQFANFAEVLALLPPIVVHAREGAAAAWCLQALTAFAALAELSVAAAESLAELGAAAADSVDRGQPSPSEAAAERLALCLF